MKRILTFMAISCALCIVAGSCGSSRRAAKTESADKSTSSNMPGISAVPDNSGNSFDLRLISSALTESDVAENVVVSPYSASAALSMLLAGARGETYSALEGLLGSGGFTDISTSGLSDSQGDGQEAAEVRSANSIWLAEGFSVKDDYLKKLGTEYSASVFERDFSSPSAVRDINGWCAEKTSGKIPSILDKINPSVRMFLINALYFKAPWLHPFNPSATCKRPFYGTKGEENVSFMREKNKYLYVELYGNQVICLPYKDMEHIMMIVLPGVETGTEGLLPYITDEYMDMAWQQMEQREVVLHLPKFKVNTSMIMNGLLSSMGADVIFSPRADFGGISDSSLAVDEVRQKCCVEVDEEGSEAAAVTSIGVRMTSVAPDSRPVVMVVDRPFYFMIKNSESGNILFAGRISNMK